MISYTEHWTDYIAQWRNRLGKLDFYIERRVLAAHSGQNCVWKNVTIRAINKLGSWSHPVAVNDYKHIAYM